MDRNTACSICFVCMLIWDVLVMAGCCYVVFVLGHSGWWFVLACVLASGHCRAFRSPEQMRTEHEIDKASQ